MYEMPGIEQIEELLDVSSIMSLLSAIPSALINLAVYIVTSLALYTLANRRGIKNPWLAWIPLGNMWILGAIADDYQLKAKGQKKARRKVLLGTSIATSVIAVIAAVLSVVMVALIMAGVLSGMDVESPELPDEMILTISMVAIATLLFSLPLLVLGIIQAVFSYIALYDLYRSCDPGNAVLYLVLSIFINITQPVFLMLCRTKDKGMPIYQPPSFAWTPPAAPSESMEQN